jgi:hypothetical protein
MKMNILECARADGMVRDDDKLAAIFQLGNYLKDAQEALAMANQVEHWPEKRSPENTPDTALKKVATAIEKFLAKYGTHERNILGMSLAEREERLDRRIQRDHERDRAASGSTPAPKPNLLLETAREMGLAK